MLKSDRTRQRILDTAAQEFRKRGYAGTKVNDIAFAANMRAASIYYYFESKDQIFEEVLEIGLRLVFEAVRRAVDSVPAESADQMVKRIFRSMDEYAKGNPAHDDRTVLCIRIGKGATS